MIENGLKYYDSRTATKEEFLEDLSEVMMPDDISGNNMAGGPILFREGKKLYVDNNDSHTLFIGNTSSMKTLRFVLPLIYSSAMAEESMIIVDPKGELVRKTNLFLKQKGYNISILNWRNPRLSPNGWDPMERINRMYKQGGAYREEAINDLNDLLNELFFQRSDASKDIYWNESAGRLGLGLCKLILALGEDLSIKTLLEWKSGKLKDGTVRSYFDALPADDDIYQNLSGFMNLSAENTKSCIESTFDQLMGLFSSSKDLCKMMSRNCIDIENVGIGKNAVFLVIPDEKTTYHFLASLYIKQSYEILLRKAEEYEGKLPVRVNYIMEEFCNMPKVNDLTAMLTAARSRNIRFYLVIQSYSQMVDKYGEHVSKTIMDNCGNLIYLHTNELSFLKYISNLAGKNEYGRPLLSVSRLQHLQKNETLIFHERCYPFMVKDLPLIFEYPIILGNDIPVLKDEDEDRCELKKPILK